MGILNFFKNKVNESEINKIRKRAKQIIELENEISKLDNKELRNKTEEFKQRLKKGESLDDILNEVYAVVREAAYRVIGLKAYEVQIIGAIVLHQGRIAQMRTGEGKTLVAIFPLYLNALEEKGVHLVTVNDYLAKYQSLWMGEVFEFMNMSVGCITNELDTDQRQIEYAKDVTYGTNNEFGFDYLRDNMVQYSNQRKQRGYNFAIVDEVDSILIDEARTPLIISGSLKRASGLYARANNFVKNISRDEVIIDEKENTIMLDDEIGVKKAEKFFGIDNLTDPENMEIYHHINQAIRAKFMMKKDNDYVVKDGEVIIVDEFTGRLMPGRRYSNGLHQAIEEKEGIAVQDESQTLATITLQNYFRMYNKLSGMTGTAKTEEEEFKEIYNMDVVDIPTNKPVQRKDYNDVIYGKREFKDAAIINEIKEKHAKGQPILVGTISVEYSEHLSKLLKREGIKHTVLNAKNHKKEAEIVSQAGRFNAVTIATNMAGRGTDIMLGGNVDFILRNSLTKKGYDDEVITKAISPFKYDDEDVNKCLSEIEKIKPLILQEVEDEAQKVIEAGGLHVIGTSRHESRRIDNQLRGRSGRQGDVGSSQFFISLDDDLIRIFMNEKVTEFMNKIGMDEGMPIEAKIITSNIEKAQKKVEGIHYGSRKVVLKYDEVMNKQRTAIYSERNKVLDNESLKDNIYNMINELIEDMFNSHLSDGYEVQDWDMNSLKNALQEQFHNTDILEQFNDNDEKEEIIEKAKDYYINLYEKRQEIISEEDMRELERIVLLQIIDNNWMNHIDDMDNLREGIGLRAYAQIDPMQAYQIEGFDMYEQMTQNIKTETIKSLYGADLTKFRTREVLVDEIPQEQVKQKTFVKKEKKISRNAPCACGSGKKYKHCCGRN